MKRKKILALVLAAGMVMASSLTAFASTNNSGSGTSGTEQPGNTDNGGSGTGGTEQPSPTTAPSSEDKSSSSSSSSSSSESENSDSSAEAAAAVVLPVQSFAQGSVTTIGGSKVQTTVGGVYFTKAVAGVAVVTPLADVKASLGLTDSMTPHVILFDTDVKKSHLAMQCVNDAIAAYGGNFVTALNIDLGARQGGKRVSLSNGSAGLMIGLPKNADLTKTYYVVCVQPGGVVTVLEDADESPASVTFEIKAGLGTYAIAAR